MVSPTRWCNGGTIWRETVPIAIHVDIINEFTVVPDLVNGVVRVCLGYLVFVDEVREEKLVEVSDGGQNCKHFVLHAALQQKDGGTKESLHFVLVLEGARLQTLVDLQHRVLSMRPSLAVGF